MKTLILTFLFLQSGIISAQIKPNPWKEYSEKVNTGYTVQFKFPPYYKLDRIENCMCIGFSTNLNENNNTMDWGIWIDEINNYLEPDSTYLNTMFNNDFVVVKKEKIFVSNHEGLHTIIKQKKGAMYHETIVVKLKDCIFEIINGKGESDDFIKFYRSISITTNAN